MAVVYFVVLLQACVPCMQQQLQGKAVGSWTGVKQTPSCPAVAESCPGCVAAYTASGCAAGFGVAACKATLYAASQIQKEALLHSPHPAHSANVTAQAAGGGGVGVGGTGCGVAVGGGATGGWFTWSFAAPVLHCQYHSLLRWQLKPDAQQWPCIATVKGSN
jgi:hypothetical protein